MKRAREIRLKATLIKETPAHLFSCEFCKILKNIYFRKQFHQQLFLYIARIIYQPGDKFACTQFITHSFDLCQKQKKCFWLQIAYENFFFLSQPEHAYANLRLMLNPLSVNPTKWSNALKQFVGNFPKNCLSVFDHFVRLALKGLKYVLKIEYFVTVII